MIEIYKAERKNGSNLVESFKLSKVIENSLCIIFGAFLGFLTCLLISITLSIIVHQSYLLGISKFSELDFFINNRWLFTYFGAGFITFKLLTEKIRG